MGVIDPLGGAVPVSRLARAGKRWDDLIVVLTAEQLGLTGVYGDPWNKQKLQVSENTVLGTPHCLTPASLGQRQDGSRKGGGNTAVPQWRAFGTLSLALPGMWPPGLSSEHSYQSTSRHTAASQAPLAWCCKGSGWRAPQSSLLLCWGSKNIHHTMSCVPSTQAPRPGLQNRY